MTNLNQVRLENRSTSAANSQNKTYPADDIPQEHPAYPYPIPEWFRVIDWGARIPLTVVYEFQRKSELEPLACSEESACLQGAWIFKRALEGALDLGEQEHANREEVHYNERTKKLYASPKFQSLAPAIQNEVREFLTVHRRGPRPFPPSISPTLRRKADIAGECLVHDGRLVPVVPWPKA